ncbi:MAG: rod shape-determining protein RodA [Phycisphaerae bacterium]|nr:rod shape-determining protein RodA [Phycisphaerae bacterium]
MPEQKLLNLTRLGWGLAIPVVFLSVIGLACIHATDRSSSQAPATDSFGEVRADDAGWPARAYRAVGPLTTKQIVFLATGVGLMLLMLKPSYQKIGRYTYPLYGLVIGLLLLLVVGHFLDRFGRPDLPFVPERRGTFRWIGLGPLQIQPSEFMKIALILTLARYLRFRNSYRRWRGLIAPFLLTVLPMVLILFQPDLGTLLMLLPVLFAMLFVAGARRRHLLIVILLGCATMPLFYLYGMKDYQQARIQVLFKQNVADEAWHMAEGYQLRQSKIALGTGGAAGEGYRAGIFVQYDGLLPEEHNDFIYAIIGHQWGLIGGALVMIAYGVIVLVGLEVATVTNDPFGRLLAVGVVVMIVVQALLNICMTLGLAPITGMTLPFVSAGGSSLWANFLALGLLVNVAQRRPLLIAHPPFEYQDDE